MTTTIRVLFLEVGVALVAVPVGIILTLVLTPFGLGSKQPLASSR